MMTGGENERPIPQVFTHFFDVRKKKIKITLSKKHLFKRIQVG